MGDGDDRSVSSEMSAREAKHAPRTSVSLEFLFLSHLLIAGCDIGVQISVRPYVRSSVRSFVRPSVNIYVEV